MRVQTLARPPFPRLAFGWCDDQRLLTGDRRDHAARERLVRRVREEFREMPGMRLTGPQSARLFAIAVPVCGRVLAALVREGTLCTGGDGRYGVRPPC